MKSIALRFSRNHRAGNANQGEQAAPAVPAPPASSSHDAGELRAFVKMASKSDEDGLLLAAFQDVPPASRAAVFSGPEGSQLALSVSQQLIKSDRRDTLWVRDVLQKDMHIAPRETNVAPLMLLATDAANNARLAHASFLVSTPHLMRDDVLQSLPSVAEELLASGELDPVRYLSTFSCSHEDATRLMIEGKLPYSVYSQYFALPLENVEAAIESGAMTGLEYLKSPGVDKSLASVMIEMNMLSVNDALPYLFDQDQSWGKFQTIQSYVKSGHLSWDQYVCNPAALPAVVRGAIQQDLVTVKHLRLPELNGANRDVLVEALYVEGRIGATEANRYALSTWSPEKPFSKSLLDTVYGFKSDDALCDGMQLPGKPGDKRNITFLTRALGFYFSKTDYDSVEMREKRAKVAEARLPEEIAAAKTCECVGCGDKFDPETSLNKLESCEHEPTMCTDCFIGNFDANGGGWNCPDKLCGERKLTPNEVFQLGLGPSRADAVATKVLGDARAELAKPRLANGPIWQACSTEECPSGKLLAYDTEHKFDCRCCSKTTKMFTLQPVQGDKITAEERENIKFFIKNTKAIAKAAGGGTRDTPVVTRFCFGCGGNVERMSGCNLVRCKCGCLTDVVWGEPKKSAGWGDGLEHGWELGPMCYVPKKGWAVELGLFKGAVPGKPVTEIMQKNLAILEKGGAV